VNILRGEILKRESENESEEDDREYPRKRVLNGEVDAFPGSAFVILDADA
jgi:hypothetical protein